jgi:hypothetical protein
MPAREFSGNVLIMVRLGFDIAFEQCRKPGGDPLCVAPPDGEIAVCIRIEGDKRRCAQICLRSLLALTASQFILTVQRDKSIGNVLTESAGKTQVEQFSRGVAHHFCRALAIEVRERDERPGCKFAQRRDQIGLAPQGGDRRGNHARAQDGQKCNHRFRNIRQLDGHNTARRHAE